MLRFGFTTILLLLNALWVALFAYQWFGSHSSYSARQNLKVQRRLLDLQFADIKFSNGALMRFEKIGSEWRMTTPVDWEVHPLVMDRFIQAILTLNPKFILKIDAETDLSKYGLEFPLCTLTLTADENYQLVIGKSNNDEKKTYLFIPETREIFSVADTLSELLEMPPASWVFPCLWNFKTLKTIAVEASQQNVLLERTDSTWFLKLPLPVPIDARKADALCQRLRHLNIERFLEEEEVQTYRQAFGNAARTLRVLLSDGKTTENLKLLPTGNNSHSYIAQRNDKEPLFLIKTDAIEQLLHAPEVLCERTVFNLDLPKILQIAYRQQTAKVILRPLDKNEWELSSQTEGNASVQTQKIPASRVQLIVDFLNTLWVKTYLSDAPDLTGKSHFDLEIATQDNLLPATLYYDDDGAYVQLANKSIWMQLTAFDPNAFQAFFLPSESKTVWQWNTDERVVQVQLKSPRNETVEQLSFDDYKGMALAHLKADCWLKNEPSWSFPTDTYTLIITTEDDAYIPRSYKLTFSERISGSLQMGGYLEKKFTFTPEWMDFLFRITHQKEQDDALRSFLKP